MKANELRIGNFVYLTDKGKVWEILDGHEIDECDDNPFVNPIQINYDWMLKFGYVHNDHSSEFHGKNMIFHNWLKDRGYIRWGTIPIKYVHQLQNLYFAFTGEELKTKLL